MNTQDPRQQLAQQLLSCTYEALTPIQRSVIDLIANEAPSGVDPLSKLDDRTFWQRMADHVAAIGGSWTFIFSFIVVLLIWMGWNVVSRVRGLAFDPYPFIFLNLMLSMVAAIQAPLILMSQNRQTARDRQAAEHDYVVNLRAELEIMLLHDKVDAVRRRDLLEVIKRQNETLRLLRAQVAQPPPEPVKPARRGARTLKPKPA